MLRLRLYEHYVAAVTPTLLYKPMGYADFADAHPEVPWRSMRGMRNRIAHGYFDINLDVVWDTVQTALPELLKHLYAVNSSGSR